MATILRATDVFSVFQLGYIDISTEAYIDHRGGDVWEVTYTSGSPVEGSFFDKYFEGYGVLQNISFWEYPEFYGAFFRRYSYFKDSDRTEHRGMHTKEIGEYFVATLNKRDYYVLNPFGQISYVSRDTAQWGPEEMLKHSLDDCDLQSSLNKDHYSYVLENIEIAEKLSKGLKIDGRPVLVDAQHRDIELVPDFITGSRENFMLPGTRLAISVLAYLVYFAKRRKTAKSPIVEVSPAQILFNYLKPLQIEKREDICKEFIRLLELTGGSDSVDALVEFIKSVTK